MSLINVTRQNYMYTVGCTAIQAAQATQAKKSFKYIIDNFNQNVT